MFNLLAPELFFFLILAHPVYKIWIIQEPNTLELWNKLHFEEKKRTVYTVFKIFSTCRTLLHAVNKFVLKLSTSKLVHFEHRYCFVLPIGHFGKRTGQKYNSKFCKCGVGREMEMFTSIESLISEEVLFSHRVKEHNRNIIMCGAKKTVWLDWLQPALQLPSRPPGPAINYTGPREVLLEFVIFVF